MARFMAALVDLEQRRTVTVGVHEDAGEAMHPGGHATIAQVASYQEFGTREDPPAAFVRGAADAFDGAGALRRAGERALRSAIFGTGESGHVDRAFARVGEQLARQMRRRAPVDTGAVRDAIAVKVNGAIAAGEDLEREVA